MTAQDLFERLSRMTFQERKAFVVYAARLRRDGRPGWNDPVIGLLPKSEVVLSICYTTDVPQEAGDGR